MKKIKNSLNKCLRSFGFANKGIISLTLEENNFAYHILATLVVTGAGFYFSISTEEWTIIILTIGSVMCAEAFNTAIEKLCDVLHPGRHPIIGKVKDISAGGVLLASIAAAIIGALIFWKYLTA